MNKKFLSAIMCGALLTASTSVFVSCEDYGDDIAHLQTQIDQNATTAASELAAKVAALEGQLSTLKAAQESMKDQLVAAKAEAAAAANNALLAAQAAQAAADKAQGGADEAKAAAAAAQAAADAAAKNLSDAVTRVAVLESKVASLETTIVELSASNKELGAKLNDLQIAFNSLSATVGSNSAAISANAEEIKAIKADIVSQVASLNAQIATVSSTIGGQIDAINAELNTIKANYATKSELNETAANLAAVSKKLDDQIAANNAYVAQMETVVAELEAKDAAAAALIASNFETTMAEIAKTNAALAEQKKAVEAEFVAVKAQIADIEASVAELARLATANYNDIATLRQALEEKTTEIYDLISQLASADRGLNADIQTIFEALLEVTTTANDNADLISQLIGADKGFAADIETILVNLESLNTSAADAADQIAQLIGADKGLAAQIEAILVDYNTNKEDVADQISQLIGADKGFAAQIEAILVDYTQNKADVEQLIADLILSDRGLAAEIEKLMVDYTENKADVEQLISELAGTDRGLAAQIEAILVDYNTNKEDVADQISQLIGSDRGLAAEIEKLMVEYETNKADVEQLISELAGTDRGLAAQIEAILVDYTENKADVEQLISELILSDRGLAADIEKLMVDYETNKEVVADLISQLAGTDRGLAAEIEKILVDYSAHKVDVLDQLSQLAATDRGLNADIENLLIHVDSICGVTANNEANIAQLSRTIAQLIAQDETFKGQIESLVEEDVKLNAAIEAVNKAIAALQAKDSELATQIENIIAENVVLRGDLATAQNDIKTLKADYEAKSAQMAADIAGIFVQLAEQGGEIDEIKAAYDGHLEKYAELVKNHDDLVAVVEALKTLVGTNKEATDAAIEGLGKQFAADLQAAIAGVNANIDAINTWKEGFLESYNDQLKSIQDQFAAIESANAELVKNYNEIIAGIDGRVTDLEGKVEDLQGNVSNLNNSVDALLSRLQSVVFIPKYHDFKNVVITPVTVYTAATYEADGETPMAVPAKFSVDFRVKPANLVAEFVEMVNNGQALVEIYVESALQTRATDKTSVEVISVAQSVEDPEVITVTATTPRLNETIAPYVYHPATLVITDAKSQSEFTTEYFNLVERTIDALDGEIFPNDGIKLKEGTDSLELCYVHIDTVRNVLKETYVEYPEEIAAIYEQDLDFFGAEIDGKLYKYNDAEEWKKFLDEAYKFGFEFHKDAYTFEAASIKEEGKEDKAIAANVGNHMTMIVFDKTFGYAADGMPNSSFKVPYVITVATNDDTYEFATQTKTWNTENGSDAFTLSAKLDLEAFTVDGVFVASPADLEVALNEAYANGKYTTTGNLNSTFEFVDGVATVTYSFGAATEYKAGYNMTTVFETVYGNVTFKGAVDLAYPTDFLQHEPRFTEGVTGKFIVEAGNQVVVNDGVPAYRDGKVGSSLPAAYTNYAQYTAAGATYTFKVEGAEGEIVRGDKTFNGITYKDYLSVVKNLTNEDGVKVIATVTIDGHEVATETYGIDVLYPVEGRNLKLNGSSVEDNKQIILASSLYNNQTVSVIGNVYLDDRYNNVLFENGVAVVRLGSINTNAKVWGIQHLEYELVKATAANGSKVTSVSVSKEGNLSIVDPNISEDVTVLVRVKTVGYYYGVVDGTFEVLIKKTYGEYPAN